MEAASQNGESHPLTASDEPPLRIGCALLPKKVRVLVRALILINESSPASCPAVLSAAGCTCYVNAARLIVHSVNIQVSRYLTKRMFEVAAARGMHLCTIDHTQPLELQGHFDAIIHKLPPNAGEHACTQMTARASIQKAQDHFLIMTISTAATTPGAPLCQCTVAGFGSLFCLLQMFSSSSIWCDCASHEVFQPCLCEAYLNQTRTHII